MALPGLPATPNLIAPLTLALGMAQRGLTSSRKRGAQHREQCTGGLFVHLRPWGELFGFFASFSPPKKTRLRAASRVLRVCAQQRRHQTG